MPLRASHAEAALLLGVMAAHVVVAPYTKVEESFNTQASFDLLHKPWRDVSTFDHVSFPGVVPRTFVGPLALAAPLLPLLRYLAPSPLATLVLVRLLLGSANVAALLALRAAVAAHSSAGASLFVALCATQFHLPFYMSRPLPNAFALPFATAAHAALLRDAPVRAAALLGFAIALFRSELVLYLAPTLLSTLVTASAGAADASQSVRTRVFLTGCAAALGAAVAAAALSIAVDTYFWRRPVYPELEVFLFNAGGGSVAWGVSPAYWYFTNALPRLLGLGLPFALGGLARGPCTRLRPVVAFVALYSALPHKETRFVLYAVPALNAAAALALAPLARRLRTAARFCLRASAKRAKDAGPPSAGARLRHACGALALASALCAPFGSSLLMTAVSTAASRHNYPAAHALNRLHALRAQTGSANAQCGAGGATQVVHIDAAAAMDGISQFVYADARHSASSAECAPQWRYTKEEDHAKVDWRGVHWRVTERRAVDGFCGVLAQRGFERVDWRALRIATRDRVFVLRNRNLSEAGCESAPL